MAQPSATHSGFGINPAVQQPSRPWELFFVALWVQGLYYVATGIWPLVSIETFEMVTGPKTDRWLVMTVGVLVAAIGTAIIVTAWQRRCTLEMALLAALSAAGLTAIDVIYVARQVIPPIYLVDSLLEVPLIVIWTVFLIRKGWSG